MNNSKNLEEKEENSTAKVDQSREIVEFCNVKKILRHLAPKDTMDTPRVTLDLVMDSIKVETQLEIEAEVDKLMGKIKAIMQKDVTQVEQVHEVEMNEMESFEGNKEKEFLQYLYEKALPHYKLSQETDMKYSICSKPKNARTLMGFLKNLIPENEKTQVIIYYDPDFSKMVIAYKPITDW